MVNKSEQVNPWLKSGDVAASVTYTVIGLAGWQIRETTNKMKSWTISFWEEGKTREPGEKPPRAE